MNWIQGIQSAIDYVEANLTGEIDYEEAAKRGGRVKIFTPLSVKLSLSGGSKMDYRIEKREAFQVVCKRKSVGKPQAANATPDITAMWQELGKDGAMARLIACMPEKPVMKGLLGICFSAELDAKRFPYGIGVEYDGRDVDDDLEVVTIPAHTYAVFTSRADKVKKRRAAAALCRPGSNGRAFDRHRGL